MLHNFKVFKVFKDGKLLNNYGIFWKQDIKMPQSDGDNDRLIFIWSHKQFMIYCL